MKWTYTTCLMIFLIVFVFVFPASAGGWAVITLEEFPLSLIAGQSTTVRFMVRQHGITPMKDLDPTLQFRSSQTREAFTVEASPALGKAGLYQAEFSLPTQGTWEWSIQAFSMDQRMPDLVVTEGFADPPPAPKQPITLPIISTLAGILMATVFAGVAIRRRARWAVTMVVLGLVIGGAGLASAMSQQKLESVNSAGNPNHLGSSLSGESGSILFVAKGCVNCHYNSKIDPKYVGFRSDVGPNLSNYAGSPEFLHLWLADPASVRADAKMPNLELDAPEIEALITFLSEKPASSHPSPETKTAPEVYATSLPNTHGSKPGKNNCSDINIRDGLPVQLSRDEGSYLVLFDPSTGLPLCQAGRLSLGLNPQQAYSSDRLNMAVLGNVSNSKEAWHLRWVDLPSWNIIDTGIVIQSWTQGIAIHPDSSRIVAAQTLLSQEKEPKMLGYKLVQANRKGENQLTETPLDIAPRLVNYTHNGQYILVYGSKYDYTQGTSTTHAIIKLFDASDLSLDWGTELGDVQEGVNHTGQNNDPNSYNQWQPGLVFSPDHSTLYIIHADTDRITTIDLNTRTVHTIEIQPKLSWLERLLRSTAGVAHAKGLNGITKQASISPDGKFLYVTGMIGLVTENGANNWSYETIPLGLQVIDIAGKKIIQHIGSEASELSLSADGQTIYLRGWTGETLWTDLVDTKTMEIRSHVEKQHVYLTHTISGEEVIIGSSEGIWAHSFTILNDQKEIATLKGNGYWISIP